MNVTVDQSCPSCGTGIHDDAELEAVTGTGLLREMTANWECQSCGVAYDQTFPVGMAMVDRSGFESWVGSMGDEPLCLIVKDGADPDERERGMGTAEHREADVVEEEGSSVREDSKRRSNRM